MKKLNFEEATALFGRKGVTLCDQNGNPIANWPQFFFAKEYYVSSSNTVALKYLNV